MISFIPRRLYVYFLSFFQDLLNSIFTPPFDFTWTTLSKVCTSRVFLRIPNTTIAWRLNSRLSKYMILASLMTCSHSWLNAGWLNIQLFFKALLIAGHAFGNCPHGWEIVTTGKFKVLLKIYLTHHSGNYTPETVFHCWLGLVFFSWWEHLHQRLPDESFSSVH